MKSKVYIKPDDVLSFLGQLFRSPSALLFVIGFPVFYFQARAESSAGKKSRR